MGYFHSKRKNTKEYMKLITENDTKEYKELITKAFESMDSWKYLNIVNRETLHKYAKMCNAGISDNEAHPMALEVIREIGKSGFGIENRKKGKPLKFDCKLSLKDFLEFYEEMFEDFPDLVKEEMENLKAYLHRMTVSRKNPFKISFGRHYKVFDDYKDLAWFDQLSNDILAIIIELLEGNEKEQFLPPKEDET